jgi:hypothetical protein
VLGEIGGAATDDRAAASTLVGPPVRRDGRAPPTGCFAFTVEYAETATRSVVPLASYQALKHRFADMKMWLEACTPPPAAAARRWTPNRSGREWSAWPSPTSGTTRRDPPGLRPAPRRHRGDLGPRPPPLPAPGGPGPGPVRHASADHRERIADQGPAWSDDGMSGPGNRRGPAADGGRSRPSGCGPGPVAGRHHAPLPEGGTTSS